MLVPFCTALYKNRLGLLTVKKLQFSKKLSQLLQIAFSLTGLNGVHKLQKKKYENFKR